MRSCGRGQRQRAPVDDLADPGEQRVAGLGDRAADDDDARVEQADGAGQHLADGAAGVAQQRVGAAPTRRGPASTTSWLDVAVDARRRAAGRRSPRRWRPPRGSRRCRSGRRPSTSWGTWMWPRSPAAPWAPRRSAPSLMMPLPMPVATLTNIRWSTSRNPMCCSPSAMTLTSLSTTTTRAERRLARTPGTSKPSQPGMIGGFVGRPVACSTGPGSPMPTPARSRESRAGAAHEPAAVVDDPAQHGSGPRAMSRSTSSVASTVAARSVTARRTWVAPTSAASTTRAAGLKANCAGGRPPVDVASPAAPTSELASRASTRWAIVERPSPVDARRARCGCAARRRAGVAAGRRHRPRRRVKHTALRSGQCNFCLTSGRSCRIGRRHGGRGGRDVAGRHRGRAGSGGPGEAGRGAGPTKESRRA